MTNQAPGVANPIGPQTVNVGDLWTYQFPDNTFLDSDAEDWLVYYAEVTGGTELPDWLFFYGYNRTFLGLTQVTEIISIDLYAEDP